LGEHGILAGLPREGIHIDMSTVFPDTSQRLAQVYRERGAHCIAAPVSGRPEHAAAAQRVISLAGPAEVLARCRPLLAALGQRIIAVGDAPHLANVLKLVTNCIAIAVTETLSEAFTLADKAGLQSAPVLEMLQVLFPSLVCEVFAKRIAASDFDSPGVNVRLWLKDVGHMRQLADQVAAPLPLADLAYRHLLAALARGRGDLDAAALVTVVREVAGLAPGTR
jgi:3-hydroxyisobutyrate dehydrogenase-like beta-hydroxyacid dehydrogenase